MRKEEASMEETHLGGRSPASGHHAGEKPLASTTQDGGKIPLERHTTRSDPRLGVIPIVT
jgi:hypothetical protein